MIAVFACAMLLLAKYFTSGPGYASLHLNTCPTCGIYLHLPYSRTLNILFKVGDIIKQNLFCRLVRGIQPKALL